MRRFLKPTKVSLLMAVVLAGALVLAGCGGNGNGGIPDHFVADFDVIVVGAGAAGMPAALAASDALGAHGRVLLLEASGLPGGGFRMAAGGWNGAISAANAAGDIELSWGTTYGESAFGEGTPAGVGFPRTERLPDWDKLARVGAWGNHVRFTLFGNPSPRGRWNVPVSGTGAGMHLFANPVTGAPNWVNFIGGAYGSDSLLAAVELRDPTIGTHENTDLRNLTLRTNVRGTRLLTRGGQVSGVHAICTLGSGATFDFSAYKVILATGGYGANNAMALEYLDWYATRTSGPNEGVHINAPGLRTLFATDWYRGVVPATHQGDGFTMARALSPPADRTDRWTLGGDVAGVDLAFVAALPTAIQPVFRGAGIFMQPIGLQMNGAIVVDGEGQLIESDGVELQFGAGAFGAALVSNGIPPFHIIYNSSPRSATIAGTTHDVIAALNTAITATAGTGFRYEVLRATSIQGLAESIIASNSGLIDDAEEFVENFLATIDLDETDYFFAVRIYPGAISSWGGLRVDWRGRVLRSDNSTIANLYAVGEVAFRDFFAGGYVGGTALTIAPIQGFIAGTDAARLIRGQGPIPTLVTDDEEFDPYFDPYYM